MSWQKKKKKKIIILKCSVQSLSRVWLLDLMDCSTPGLPVLHPLPEFTQTHARWVGDAIKPSHPLSSPSPPAFNLSQNQGLWWWVSSSHPVAKVLEFQVQHHSFQRRAVFPNSILCPWDSPAKNTRMGCHFPLQGIFPTQESNLGLLHCRQIIYWLSYKGSLFYPTTMNYFLIGLWHVMKSGLYMKTSYDQLSGWTEKLLQSTSRTCTTKVMITVRRSAARLIH